MAPRHCDHDIPESLIFILNDNPPLCLACQVQSRIDEIKQIQADLAWRGGIFVSKAHALSSPAGSEQRMQHKEITRRWRRVKRTLYEDLCFYEKLKEEEPDIALEWGVDNALAIWEKAEDACCWIPGYHYVEDETGDKNAEGAAKVATISDSKTSASSTLTHTRPRSRSRRR